MKDRFKTPEQSQAEQNFGIGRDASPINSLNTHDLNHFLRRYNDLRERRRSDHHITHIGKKRP